MNVKDKVAVTNCYVIYSCGSLRTIANFGRVMLSNGCDPAPFEAEVTTGGETEVVILTDIWRENRRIQRNYASNFRTIFQMNKVCLQTW